MLRAARHRLASIRPAHLVIGGLCCLLLVTSDGIIPRPAEAGAGRGEVVLLRRGQARAASHMRRADRKLESLKQHKRQSARRAKAARKRLARQIDRRDAVRERLEAARGRYRLAALDRDRTLLVRPNPAGIQVTDRPKLRRQVRKLKGRSDRYERTVKRLMRKVDRTRKVKQQRARAVIRTRRHIERKLRRRDRVESVLGMRITRMVELAQSRAAARGRGPASAGFRRPARGTISQGYGCQRARKGRCSHFHDGIDIAAPRGTPVRAAANGYVAYVGWNPWDRGRRAYLVIIGHAGGYETVYGHLLPVRKVRSGQFVRRGQLIGRIGNTGRSTGPHLHWEVSRGFRTLNPRSVGH